MADSGLKALNTYQKKVIELSRRNRLLKYPKNAREITFKLNLEEFKQFFGSLHDFEIAFDHKDVLCHEEKKLESSKQLANVQESLLEENTDSNNLDDLSIPWIPPTKLEGKKLLTALTALRLDSKRKFEEHGLHTLYMTIGKVQWKEPQTGRGSSDTAKSNDYSAPLLLIPISIQDKKSPKKTIITVNDEVDDLTYNKVLSHFFETQYNSRKLLFNESYPDDYFSQYDDLKKQVYSIFKELNVKVDIIDEIQVGQYAFYGQQIYEDLKKNEIKMLENSFLNALCNHTVIDQASLSIPIAEPDNFLSAKSDFTVMDADTSQLEVIERVICGNNLNVQGPPGTGKSQTIVNLIANLISNDKTVLIVCEKQVALEVVYNRLAQLNLDKLCLPLYKSSEKKTFAKSILDDRDYVLRVTNRDNLNEDLNNREENIEYLKNYAKALGKVVEPLNKTVHWVHGELSKVKPSVKQLIPWNGYNPLDVSYKDYKDAVNILLNIRPLLEVITDHDRNHWSIVNKNQYSEDYFSRVRVRLQALQFCIKELSAIKPQLVSCESINELILYKTTITKLKNLKIPGYINDKLKLTDSISILTEIIASLEEFSTLTKKYNTNYKLPSDWKEYTDDEIKSISHLKGLEVNSIFALSSAVANSLDTFLSLEKTLNSVMNSGSLKEISFSKLLASKRMLLISSNVECVNNWHTSTVVEDALVSLNNLIILKKNQEKSQNFMTSWGIVEKMINQSEFSEVLQRFNSKYTFFHRWFSKQYKADVKMIKSWCNAKVPQNHTDYLHIIDGLSDRKDKVRKFEVLRFDFIERFVKKGSGFDDQKIDLLYEELTNLQNFFNSTKQERLSSESVLLVTDLSEDLKKILHSYLTDFENDFYKVLDYYSEIGGLAHNSLDIFKSKLLEFKKTITLAIELISDVDLTCEGVDCRNESFQNILSHYDQVSQLIAVRSGIYEVISNNFFSSVQTFDDVCQKKEDLVNLLNNIKVMTEIAVELNLPSEKAITIEDIKKLQMESDEIFESISDQITQFNKNMHLLDNLLGRSDSLFPVWSSMHLDELSLLFLKLSEDETGLASWMEFSKYKKKMVELGFDWFIEDLAPISEENIEAQFAASLWEAWLDMYYKKTESLRNFNFADHNRVIKEFKRIEHKSREINSLRILNRMANKIDRVKWNYGSFESELVRQSQRKRSHKPIRKVISDVGNQIIEYKRCWMMNPLSLSTYIPYGSLEFDVVIFDEASQMKVEHALGSIARAKQVVIFGDENQLPPTSFFNVSDTSDDDGDEEDYESILNATKEILPGADRLLSYHYRSKYEDLISFSNHFIYDDKLTTFPNPKKSFDPIKFVYVENGIFDGGSKLDENGKKVTGSRKNYNEAEKVASLCLEHVQNFPEKSLGVIAFSRSQEAAIRDSLAKLLEEHLEFADLLNEDSDRLERFFIKNLESVQGDERDVIILSVGYGRDIHGNMYQRFGPINSSHGYRRLNVAVTRAKESILCVSSIKSIDIRGDNASRGVKLLQKYLEYAEYGSKTLSASKLTQDQKSILHDSPFEAAVERELQKAGLTIHRQVGASGYKIDLAIVDPKNDQQYLLGIECDGAAYHSSYSARMNDRIRQENLENLGWKIYRIWSQHWLTDSENIVNDIVSEVQKN